MIELRAGALRLVLDPETGGAIAAFTHNDVALLRPVRDPRLAAQQGRAVAGYPLIPFANRIAHGRFSCGGTPHQLALNFAGHPHTIHGNAWMRKWRVAASDSMSAHLVLDHAPPADPAAQWPFCYRAEQVFTLAATTLRVAMSAQNTDTVAWPAGLGFHPYVARDEATDLRFAADTVWLNGADALPATREAVAHHWDFSNARQVGDTAIDECYAGWGGAADITWRNSGLALRLRTSTPFDHLQLYTPPGMDFFGLEPVSNMPDAINRMDSVADNGLKILAPGETLTAQFTIDIATHL